jgi:site-specific recombinase XerD
MVQTNLKPVPMQKMVLAVINQKQNENTRQNYSSALSKFFSWYHKMGHSGLNREIIREYILYMEQTGYAKSTISTNLSITKQLFNELWKSGVIDNDTYAKLKEIRIKGQKGQKIKTWLNHKEAQLLMKSIRNKNDAAIRDKAILATMLGSGLRRFEVSELNCSQIGKVEQRWAFTNIKGKGERYRTVAIPEWSMNLIERWLEARNNLARNFTDKLFFSIRKNGTLGNTKISPQAIRNITRDYSIKYLGKPVLPHDLRRSYAQLSYRAGAPLRQVQISLGHSSIRTTEIYLGLDQDFIKAPGDYIEIEI